MTVLLRGDEAKSSPPESRPGEGCLITETDVLDWDACIETPPPRAQGAIHVLMNYAGRGQPVPLANPEVE
jgi:hypothetical protein